MSYELQITDLGYVDQGSGATAPKVVDLVSLAEAKAYLKQSYSSQTAEDAIITTMIESARRWIENYLGKSIISKSIVAFTRDEFAEFELPLPPVTSVTTVKRIYLDGTSTTLAKNTDYYEIGRQDKVIQFMAIWGTSSFQIAGIEVTYTAAMTDAYDLAICKQACLDIVAENYYNRGDSTESSFQLIPFNVKTKLNPLRLMRHL